MNKGRRQEITQLKHKMRCKRLGLKPEGHYAYKAQTRPCSCYICKADRYKRNIKHKRKNNLGE